MNMHRSIPDLSFLPRSVYSRAESLLAGSWTALHSHPWIQFTYAASGVLEVRTRQGNHFAPPHRAVWIPAGLLHAVGASASAEQSSLYIAPQAVAGLEDIASTVCRVVAVTPLVRELVQSFVRFPAEYDEQGAQGRLVAVLLDELLTLRDAGLSLPLPDDSRLESLCQTMLGSPGAEYGLEQCARQTGMSPRTLSRKFRTETGLSLRQWRQRARMLSALPELERGRSVTAVALEMGYDSTSAFIAAFRQLLGVTPGEFLGAAMKDAHTRQ